MRTNAPKGLLPATREILDVIGNFLLRRNDESAQLVAILSALRGPDVEGDSHLKSDTTVQIRRAAFPMLEHYGSPCGIDTVDPTGTQVWATNLSTIKTGYRSYGVVVLPQKGPTYHKNHFRNHIILAATALGLKIQEREMEVKVTQSQS